jgi:hypothetical protein
MPHCDCETGCEMRCYNVDYCKSLDCIASRKAPIWVKVELEGIVTERRIIAWVHRARQIKVLGAAAATCDVSTVEGPPCKSSPDRHMLRHHLSMEGKRSDPFFFNMTSECRN